MAFVVSAGSLRSLDRPRSLPSTRLQLADDFTQDYAEIWRTQPAVRTVISFLARNIASLKIHAFERLSDTDRRRLNEGPLPELLAKPNPRTTRYRLINGLVHDLGIFDTAYWLKLKDPGLLRLPPSMTKPIGDNWMWPDGFELKGGKGKATYRADQVVHFHGYNPDDSRTGASPIESLRQILAEEYAAGRMREQTVRNGARMSGYITRPKESPWSPEAKQKFRAQWQSQYSGSGPSAGGTPILEDGMTFEAHSQTAEQLQYVQVRKLTREEVAAAYFIPPPMVGLLDQATFSNITEQHKMLYQDTLGPWLTMISEEIGLQLIPDLADDSVYVEFNLAEKLKGSFEEQAKNLQTATGAPWLTRNESRARMNLPAIEGGDELVVPLNVLVGGQASPTDAGTQNEVPKAATVDPVQRELTKATRAAEKAATAPQRQKIAEVLQGFFERQGKAVLSRIGAGEDWWDGKRWDAELADDLAKASHTLAALLGSKEAERLGFEDGYDPDMTVNFLRTVAADRAAGINATTKAQLDEELATEEGDPAVVFETAANSRAAATAGSVATFVGAFAAVEAAKQIAASEGVEPTKTWITGSNPRASHARMDGETVPIGEKFSNGMDWPGQGDADDAGCNCDVAVSLA